MRLNPAPIGALSPAVPKLIRLQSLTLNSSRRAAATRASTWARVLPFYSRHRKRPLVTTNTHGGHGRGVDSSAAGTSPHRRTVSCLKTRVSGRLR